MLLPLALSHHFCRPVSQCSIFETVFLLLATVSAVNLLTTVLNDTPLMPDDDGIDIDWLVNSPDAVHWLHEDDDDDGGGRVKVPPRLFCRRFNCDATRQQSARPGVDWWPRSGRAGHARDRYSSGERNADAGRSCQKRPIRGAFFSSRSVTTPTLLATETEAWQSTQELPSSDPLASVAVSLAASKCVS